MKKPRPHRPGRQHASAPPARRPTISLCVIARDEEGFIGDCLASARPFVDEIVVLDTGSTDATIDIARSYGARIGNFEWRDDFAAARNAAIALARCDWIFMLDADERLQLESGPPLRQFLNANPSRPAVLQIYSPRIESREDASASDPLITFHARIFPRMPGLRYIGAVHEDVAFLPDPGRANGARLDFVRITHLGYLAEVVAARGKFARNRRLLLLETVARPEDPRPWYFLGMDELIANRPAEAADYFRRSLARGPNRPTWSTVDVYSQLVVSYTRLNDTERLESIVDEAERAHALSVSTRILLAQLLLDRGLHAAAVRHLLQSLEPDQPLDTVRQPGVGGWITRMDLARVYEHLGDLPSALHQVELGLADPELHDRGVLADTAVRLAIQVGDMPSLARCLADVTQPDERDLAGHLRQLELRALAGPAPVPSRASDPVDRGIGLGDWQVAYDAARVLSGRTMPEAARMLFVATRLQRGGAADAALGLLERLYDAQPRLPEVHALLVGVLKDLGRYDDALAANEILQTLLIDQKQAAAA
jgi:glycosyltransferase involved in cell wall biosynthesis